MDELDYFIENAFTLVMSGFYNVRGERPRGFISMTDALRGGRAPVIAEFKRRTPSVRDLSSTADLHGRLQAFFDAGVCAFSVLTEPHRFDGSLDNVPEAALFGLPVLMKDFTISTDQIEAARRLGADCILLILEIFNRSSYNLDVLMEDAHSSGLEVIVEVNSQEQYRLAMQTDADIIGINNRNLSDLTLDEGRTERILLSEGKDRPVIGMSGIATRGRVESILHAGADGVLVGTSVMGDSESALKAISAITEAAIRARSKDMR